MQLLHGASGQGLVTARLRPGQGARLGMWFRRWWGPRKTSGVVKTGKNQDESRGRREVAPRGDSSGLREEPRDWTELAPGSEPFRDRGERSTPMGLVGHDSCFGDVWLLCRLGQQPCSMRIQ